MRLVVQQSSPSTIAMLRQENEELSRETELLREQKREMKEHFLQQIKELEEQVALLQREHKQTDVANRMLVGTKQLQLISVKEQLEVTNRQRIMLKRDKQTSQRLLNEHFIKQREALLRAQQAQANYMATRIIQHHARAKLTRTQTDLAMSKLELRRLIDQQQGAKLLNEAAAHLKEQEQIKQMNKEKEKQMLMLRGRDGQQQPLGHWLKQTMGYMLQKEVQERRENRTTANSKYFHTGDEGIGALTVGRPEAAALGLESTLKVDAKTLHTKLSRETDAIRDEVMALGDEEAIECLDYVLNKAAGSSDKIFSNSPYPRDCDAGGLRTDRRRKDGGGMVLADFLQHHSARTAHLSEAHLVALRLYSTAAFKVLNGPLREHNRTAPHPLAATIMHLTNAIKKLRSVNTSNEESDLWRGMRNLAATDEFEANGGTEAAPMSTTTDVKVAVSYALGERSLLFKIVSAGFMERGADITFCSAFPNEKECVYPPLTYLRPTGRREHVEVQTNNKDGHDMSTVVTVIEVVPSVA